MTPKLIDKIFLSSHFAILIIALTLSIISYNKIVISDHDYKFLYDLNDNWKDGPIIQITLNDEKCLEDQGELNLFNNYWMGTRAGRNCGTKEEPHIVHTAIMQTKIFEETNAQIYCDDIPAIEKILYTKWNNKFICGKRINKNYFELDLTMNECPKNKFSCGIADTTLNKYCVDDKRDCPVNKIFIDNVKDKTEPGKEYFSLQFNSNKYLHYTNQDYNGEITHKFQIYENKPCLDKGYYNTDVQIHFLDFWYGRTTCPAFHSGQTNDDRELLLDNDLLINVYEMNGISKMLNKLPGYQTPPDTKTTGLYSFEYYGLEMECRKIFKELGLNNFLNNLNKFESIFNASKYWCIASSLIIGLNLVLLICYSYFLMINYIKQLALDVKQGVKDENKGFISYKNYGIVFFLPLLLIAVISSIYLGMINSIPRDFQILLIEGCTDKFTFQVAEKFNTIYHILLGFVIGTAVLSYFLFLFIVIFSLVKFNKINTNISTQLEEGNLDDKLIN